MISSKKEYPKTPLELLKAVDELFSGPEKWTKGMNARTKTKRKTFAESKAAVCWCLRGGIMKILGPNTSSGYSEYCNIRDIMCNIIKVASSYEKYYKNTKLITRQDLVIFNDHPATTFEDIKEVIKLSIESLENPVSELAEIQS